MRSSSGFAQRIKKEKKEQSASETENNQKLAPRPRQNISSEGLFAELNQ